MRSSLKAQCHAVLAKEGRLAPAGLWTDKGSVFLDELELGEVFAYRLATTRDLVEVFDERIDAVEQRVHARLRDNADYRLLRDIRGIGAILAPIFVAEIGDASRFDSHHRIASWAGLTPKHEESDLKVRRGRITKQGSRLVRWAAIEAVTEPHCHPYLAEVRARIEARRPTNVAKVAAVDTDPTPEGCRKLLGCA